MKILTFKNCIQIFDKFQNLITSLFMIFNTLFLFLFTLMCLIYVPIKFLDFWISGFYLEIQENKVQY